MVWRARSFRRCVVATMPCLVRGVSASLRVGRGGDRSQRHQGASRGQGGGEPEDMGGGDSGVQREGEKQRAGGGRSGTRRIRGLTRACFETNRRA